MKTRQLLTAAILAAATLTASAQQIKVAGQTIMSKSDFGLTTNKRAWDATSKVISVSRQRRIVENYTMITGKRSSCHNEGLERVYTFQNADGELLSLVVRKYSDGYAFRYELNTLEGEIITAENTRFHIPAAAKRWMQQYDGPGYEHFFPLCPGGISPEGEKITQWGYPALFELKSGSQYMLISDSYNFLWNCGSMLTNTPDDRNTYSVKLFSDDTPAAKKWHSAWHVIITGSLSDVVESTLITDVADPCSSDNTSWIEPGVSSWIYWAYNHGSQEYDILKQYVDLAIDMKWPYTLVDAEWDVMRGGNIKQLCDYAVSLGIRPMIWYNSTTNWTGKWAPTPQGLLNDPVKCDQEFAKISSWGVKGVKIDFFSGDTKETNKYYWQLLNAAAKHHLLVNFHGGTIPHGWQRTYPHVITCEGVYGAEWYNNKNVLTSKAACHNATLPFTRNVIGPMDYTPGTFTDSQYPHITSNAHELALPFLFESGIQHMPDRPDTYRSLPEAVRTLLSEMPTAWDDTRLLAGYPGESVVIARRKGAHWYIAGINGTDEQKTITFNVKSLSAEQSSALVITDIADESSAEKFPFSITTQTLDIKKGTAITCKPRGGFVIKL